MTSIAELRAKKNKMTQAELAKELGTDQANISRWERDPMTMSSKNLIKVALYFNVTIDELLGLKKHVV
ncbi:helix-turn-helix domain-containing protein [Aerococcaceae bacterium WGS1372]